MSLLNKVQRGRSADPLRVLLYGTPGVGKTTTASRAPGAIFLPVEDGCGALDVARLPQPRTWADVLASVRALTDEPHDFQTLIIDTLDAAEALCWRRVCDDGKKQSIEDFGYGKGYTAAVDLWRELLRGLELLQERRGVGLVLIAHSARRNFKNPEGEDYERWTLSLQERAAGLLVGWAHEVLFARWEVLVAQQDGSRAKGVSTGKRELRTREDGPWTAKNRHGLPAALPLDWDALHLALHPQTAQEVRDRIKCLLAGADEALSKETEDFVSKAGSDVGRLIKTEKWLAGRLAKKE